MRIGRLKVATAVVLAAVADARAGGFAAWPYRMQITFPGYDKPETLTNFPALVIFSTNIAESFHTQFAAPTNGGDLRFADSSRTNEINYEIEQWSTNGDSYVWVQVPRLEPTNTCIWAYWGNPNQTNPPAFATNGATWSEGFSAVWHMTEVSARDSTSNANHGTAQSTNIAQADGRIGPANSFPGSSTQDMIVANHSSSLDLTSAVTVEAWVYETSGTADPRGIVSKRNVNQSYLMFIWGSRKINGRIGGDGDSGDTSLPTGQWCHVAMTYDNVITNTERKVMYFNGANDGVRDDNNASIPSRTVNVHIGTLEPQYWCQWKGMIDEARISSVARSSNWMWACYMNQASNGWFNAYGKVMGRHGAVLTIQ